MSKHPQALAAALRELPPVDEAARQHSERVLEFLQQKMAVAGGALSFAEYMQAILYAPGLGYYSAGAQKLGETGDFITAPEFSSLFSRALARHCAHLLASLPAAELLEFGAGSGVMAADILLELEHLQALPEHYFILEISADLQQRQRQTLQSRAPHLLQRVHWLECLPERFCGVVLANEVLDAMPIQRFRWQQGGIHELGVAWRDGALVWQDLPVTEPELLARITTLASQHDWPEGYVVEFNPALQGWLQSLGEMLEQGGILLLDYGFPAHEYYHAQRSSGTLMCHYRHRAHSDPLILPGLQDVTVHVDFTAVARAAELAGLEVLGFASQANYLLANGVLELAADVADTRAQLVLAAQLKRLLMPGEMGEIFKVMLLGRGMADAGPGFSLRDERYRL